MKKYIFEFIRRGLMAAFGGPVILAIVYAILGMTGAVTSLSPGEVATGVLTVTLMAFIAAGITVVYTVESLPLPTAILTHAAVLYADYLVMYLCNDWIPRNAAAISIFSVIFFGGFALIWGIIYLCIRSNTAAINKKMRS